jgi:diguanylate cyclase (GGDEF)-like protein/PAS domain S-box-containing protein
LRLPAALVATLRGSDPERTLVDVEAQMQMLLERLEIGLFRATPGGQLLEANDVLRRLFGIGEREDITRYNLYDFYVLPRDAHGAERWRSEGEVQESEVQVRRRDGVVVWLNLAETLNAGAAEGPLVEGLAQEVTERRHAEEALWLGEEYFRTLVENASDLVYVLSADGVIRYLSPSVQQVLGFRAEELIGTDGLLLVHPKQRESARRQLKENASAPGARRRLVMRLRHRGGGWRLVEGYTESLLDNPVVGGVVVSARDITGRRQAERRRREGVGRLRRALRTAGVGVWELAVRSGRMRGSRSLSALFGMDGAWPARHYGEFLKRIHPADVEQVTRAMERAVDERSDLEVEFRVVWPDETVRWLATRGKVLVDREGRVSRILGIATDETERKRRDAELRQSEERFRLIVEGSDQVFFFVTDERLHFEYLSPSVRQVLGYTADELLGRSIRRLLSDPEEARLLAPGAQPEHGLPHRVTLLHKEGHAITVELVSTPLEHDGRATGAQGFARDVTERKRMEDKLLHDAFHDALTGLANRALFMDRLHHTASVAERHPGYTFAVLIVDLDHFKRVNDTLGHLVGDQLLVAVARRLERCLRPGDTVTRFGGDEFTILLEDLRDLRDATRVANRILRELSTPFQLGAHEVHTGGSIGVALSSTGYARPEDLLRNADTALYRAKVRGRGGYEAFDRAMHQQALQLLRMESDLQHAIERREMSLAYHPIVSLKSGGIVGFEALLRWKHASRGAIHPADFIPVAEESGVIVELDGWVVEEACRQLQAWTSAAGPSMHLSVNLSGREFGRPELVERIRQTLRDTGCAAGAFGVELSERALGTDHDAAAGMLHQLREMDVQIRIDNFGTGHSGLTALHRLPIHSLKIDRALVSRIDTDPASQGLVAALVTFAQNLDLTVIAEGVETAAQLHALREMGCDFAQGFYFAEPMPAEAAEELLAAGPSW